MKLINVVIALIIIEKVEQCNIQVCLKWYVQENHLQLQCKVNNLKYTVSFINNKNLEQGYCVSPEPKPDCHNNFNNVRVSQIKSENITFLTMMGEMSSTFNGLWTCKHGEGGNRDSTNVTVVVPVLTNKGACWKSYFSWTFIGCVISLIGFTIWIHATCRSIEGINIKLDYKCVYTKEKCIPSCITSKKKLTVCKVVALLLIVLVLLAVIPYLVSLLEGCKLQEIFILPGFGATSFLLVFIKVRFSSTTNVPHEVENNRDDDSAEMDAEDFL